MATMGTQLRQEIRDGDAETRRHMDFLHGQLLERLAVTAAETRRYISVVAEGLKSDIKAVAEGLGALDEKVELFRGEVNQEFAKVDRRLLHLQVRVIDRPNPS
jgi:tetrahydromethanopterin S-methyltransferase subunit G